MPSFLLRLFSSCWDNSCIFITDTNFSVLICTQVFNCRSKGTSKIKNQNANQSTFQKDKSKGFLSSLMHLTCPLTWKSTIADSLSILSFYQQEGGFKLMKTEGKHTQNL